MKFRKPMAAKNFDAHEHRVVYPCYVQPKLDGIRCITDGKNFWSRNGKLFPAVNTEHLQSHLQKGLLVDGELIIPGAKFEETVSAVKHASDDDRRMARKLRFCVFDIMTDGVFSARSIETKTVVAFATEFGARWKLVPTYRAKNRQELDAIMKKMLKQGHEGVMVRNSFGLYVSRKTHDLLKRKPLLDAEYKIVGVKEARGKDKGTPIFICKVGKHLFRVRPMGSMAIRRHMWNTRARLIGRKLTVEFQNLTKYGVPRFPRAKILRDYE